MGIVRRILLATLFCGGGCRPGPALPQPPHHHHRRRRRGRPDRHHHPHRRRCHDPHHGARPGWWCEAIGGSTVGPQRVALARPDGYTLLLNNIGFAASATLYRKLPYNVLESFAPLGLVSDAAMTLVARPDFPASDLRRLHRRPAGRRDKLNLAHAGLGSAAISAGCWCSRRPAPQATTVVFRGTAPGDRRADGRAHRPALRPGDQYRALHPRQPGEGLWRDQPRPPAGARPAADHRRGGLPRHRHEHLARHVRPRRHAGGCAGGCSRPRCGRR